MKPTIITGQQIGLLGGPLYTTYKVLGAIHLARQLGGKAVYWIETNDADFNEINHLEYLDVEGQLRSLTWEMNSQGYSCGQIEIDRSLCDLLTQFFDTLRQTEFTPALRDMALRCYAPGRTLGEASRLLAQELFGRFGVELFDPSTPEFKAFIKPMLLHEAEQTPVGEQGNFFCMIGKKRMAVFRDEQGFALRDGTRVNLVECELVPNVKTRNVCQDAYFQTHTYIAGPGEIAYIRELDAQYARHGVKKADVTPRMSVTLIEPKAARLMQKQQIALDDALTLEKTALAQHIVKTQTGFDFKALTQQTSELTRAYFAQLRATGAAIERPFENAVLQALKEALGQQRAQEKARAEKLRAAAESLSDLLLPFGQKQERVFNLFYYMNLYGGLAFVDWLFERYDPTRNILEITG
ncbi:uncharacterized protein conserved in bacteria [Candidatus Moduliflexus flocculans]|uniref:Uncharacterized protein conserved in bacteria n=1 Tax=Candidatus Moduliflexus flocculans TaxID=1499966 RepID=A0A0S6VZQ7_9BACT|nr:uncharacterized protein conserved in bacteria [Candidatus Moduliflexus flocculans]